MLGLEGLERRHDGRDVVMVLVCHRAAEGAQSRRTDDDSIESGAFGPGPPGRRERPTPHRQQRTVRTRKNQCPIGSHHFDARFIGRGLKIEALAELGSHDTFKRQHQPF